MACRHRVRTREHNKTAWEGHIDKIIRESTQIPEKSLRCCHYKERPFWVALRSAQFYIVKSSLSKMITAAIHIGLHRHPVRVPPDREAAKTAIALMKQAIRDRPSATPSQVNLTCTLKIIFSKLMTRSGAPEIIQEKWDAVLDKVDPLTSKNCKNQVAREKREQFDSIIELNDNMGVDYIQSFQFPGQGAGVEPHVFKMLAMG
jgi:hypothetical protein